MTGRILVAGQFAAEGALSVALDDAARRYPEGTLVYVTDHAAGIVAADRWVAAGRPIEPVEEIRHQNLAWLQARRLVHGYEDAPGVDLVISCPDGWKTFDRAAAVEAMAAGIPVIRVASEQE